MEQTYLNIKNVRYVNLRNQIYGLFRFRCNFGFSKLQTVPSLVKEGTG